MRRWLLLAGVLSIIAPVAAAAMAAEVAQEPTIIVQARSAGTIGERYDGYVGIVSAASPTLRRQVAAINIRRRSLYSSLAVRRGATPQEVGITAACTLLGRVAAGEYYLLGTGTWQQLRAGQTPPRPDYCR